MTSAPRSARFCPAQGPASTRERSRTRMCESGPAMSFQVVGDAVFYPKGPYRLPGTLQLRQEREEHGMRSFLWKTICAAAMCVPLFTAAQQQPSDYAREKRWADEIEGRSEEHTSELQSQSNLVCRLLLEKKKKRK